MTKTVREILIEKKWRRSSLLVGIWYKKIKLKISDKPQIVYFELALESLEIKVWTAKNTRGVKTAFNSFEEFFQWMNKGSWILDFIEAE